MAIVTNTLTTFSAIGNREDLADTIYNIASIEVPLQSMAQKAKASATFHEWQSETLNAAAANAQLQGDDFTYAASITTTRLGNRTQIMRKEAVISGTQEAVNKAGRQSEMVRQLMNKSKELKRDIEFILCSNQAPVTGNTTTAPQLRPLLSWYSTNVQAGTGSPANGSTTTARTDGTQVTFTESMLQTAMQGAWINGGSPTYALAGPKQKRGMSAFTGGSTKFYSIEDKTLTATIDVYVGDFGQLKIVPSRFTRGAATAADREVHVLDPSLIGIATLRPIKTVDVAATGDAQKAVILTELTLEVRQEAGLSLIADLT
jgi:hypothetical protein